MCIRDRDEAWARQHVVFERMARALLDCPVPIIGAVNGAAYGLSLIHICSVTALPANTSRKTPGIAGLTRV